jgi:hypothetical protein
MNEMRHHGNWIIHDGKVSVWCETCGYSIEHACTDKQAEMIENTPIQAVFPELTPDVNEMFITGQCGLCSSLGYTKITPKAEEKIVNETKEILEICHLPFTVTSAEDCYQLSIDLKDNIDDCDYRDAYVLIRENMKRVIDDIWAGKYGEVEA